MKPTTMVLGFLPWIAFSIVVRLIGPESVGLSALLGIGLVLGGAAVAREVNQMTVGSLISLTGVGLLAVTTGDDVHMWLFTWAVPGLAAALGVFLLAMLPFAPFTRRYARTITPRAYWSSPLFIRTNQVLSAAWGLAMIVLGTCNILGAAMDADEYLLGDLTGYAQPIIGNLLPLAIIAAIIIFTKVYPFGSSAPSTRWRPDDPGSVPRGRPSALDRYPVSSGHGSTGSGSVPAW